MTPDLDAVRAMMEGAEKVLLQRNFVADLYVLATDYDALAAEVEANRATIAGLEARVEELTEMVARAAVWVPQDVRSWHADKDALSQKDTPDAR